MLTIDLVCYSYLYFLFIDIVSHNISFPYSSPVARNCNLGIIIIAEIIDLWPSGSLSYFYESVLTTHMYIFEFLAEQYRTSFTSSQAIE